jgi:hypothetical protein
MQQLGECRNSTSYTALVNRKSHVPLYDIHTTAEFPTPLHAVLSVLETKDIRYMGAVIFTYVYDVDVSAIVSYKVNAGTKTKFS